MGTQGGPLSLSEPLLLCHGAGDQHGWGWRCVVPAGLAQSAWWWASKFGVPVHNGEGAQDLSVLQSPETLRDSRDVGP